MKDDLDVITLRGLSAVGSHGVHEFERSGSQVFSADLRLYVDSRLAALTDDVDNTVNYAQIAEDAVDVLTGPAVYLLETLAQNLAEMALTYPLIQMVEVTVHKPMAPVRHQFSDVSVTIRRTRENLHVVSQNQAITQTPAHVATSAVEIADVRHGRASSGPRHGSPLTSPVDEDSELHLPTHSGAKKKYVVTKPRPVPLGNIGVADRPLPTLNIDRSFADGSHVYRVVIALGANQGNVYKNLRGAVEELVNTPGFEVQAVSPLIRTEPVLEQGALPQPNFYNAVLIGRTVIAPPVLLQTLQHIERQFGRVRNRRWGARTLDLDIIELDGMRLNTRDLVVPHPRAKERAFVLYPWSLIAPNDRLTGAGTVSELLKEASDLGGILSVREDWLSELPGPEEEVFLAPRLPREYGSPVGSDGIPSVRVRGEQLHLAPLDGDPLFQRLLETESARNSSQNTSQEESVQAAVDRVSAEQTALRAAKRTANQKTQQTAAPSRAKPLRSRQSRARHDAEILPSKLPGRSSPRTTADEVPRHTVTGGPSRSAGPSVPEKVSEQDQPSVILPAWIARSRRERLATEGGADLRDPVLGGKTPDAAEVVGVPSVEVVPEGDSKAASLSAFDQHALPDWRFLVAPTKTRVVDDSQQNAEVDGTESDEKVQDSSSGLPTSQTPGVSRRVTVRPTPTGSIPITRKPGRQR